MAKKNTKIQAVLNKLHVDLDELSKKMWVSKSWLKLAIRSTTVAVDDKYVKIAEDFVLDVAKKAIPKKTRKKAEPKSE